MESEMRFPRGLRSRLEYKRLAVLCPEPGASDLLWSLWEFLADSVQPNAVGVIGNDDVRFFGGTPEQVKSLVESGILIQNPDGYTCPTFTQFNTHLDPCKMSNAAKGGIARSWSVLTRRAEEMQLDFIESNSIQKDDGTLMTDLELRNARVVIRSFDGVVRFNRPATPGQWPRELILLAHEVVTRHQLSPVQDVARRLYINFSGNPRIPKTTKLCLETFEALRTLSHSST